MRAHFRTSSLRAFATAVPSAQMLSPHILMVFSVDHNMMVFFFFFFSRPQLEGLLTESFPDHSSVTQIRSNPRLALPQNGPGPPGS